MTSPRSSIAGNQIVSSIVFTLGSQRPGPRQTFIEVHDFVLPDLHHVAVIEDATAHTLGAHVDTVRAVEIFQYAGLFGGNDLGVVAADVLAVDLQIVVGRAADDLAARHEVQLTHGLALGRQHHLGEHTGRAIAGG